MNGTIYGILAGILLGMIFGCCLGFSMSRNKMRQEAIDHHAAHYSITNIMEGTTVFQWNDQLGTSNNAQNQAITRIEIVARIKEIISFALLFVLICAFWIIWFSGKDKRK